MIGTLVALVLPLGLDTFAVAAALGLAGLTSRQRTRLSLLMASFETGMPLIGLAIGVPLGRAAGSGADYVAIGVLVLFGLYMLLSGEDDETQRLGAARERERLASRDAWDQHQPG
jgi:putative Mn2+ efflux pump MntP